MYECEVCHKLFDKKSHHDRHLRISSDCNLGSKEKEFLIKENNKFYCKICGSYFSSKGNFDRHIQNVTSKCKMKDSIDRLNSNVEYAMKKITKALKNGNNVTINNFNQYLFCRPGEECVKHITKEVMLELLNMDRFTCICTFLMQDAYFNRGIPRNHNWCLAYPNNENAAVVFDYNKNEFTRESTQETIHNKFINLMDLLNPVILEIIDEEEKTGFLNKQQKKNLFLMRHFCNIENLIEDSREIYESIHKLAFKEKDIPMETWHESGLKGNHLSLKFH